MKPLSLEEIEEKKIETSAETLIAAQGFISNAITCLNMAKRHDNAIYRYSVSEIAYKLAELRGKIDALCTDESYALDRWPALTVDNRPYTQERNES